MRSYTTATFPGQGLDAIAAVRPERVTAVVRPEPGVPRGQAVAAARLGQVAAARLGQPVAAAPQEVAEGDPR